MTNASPENEDDYEEILDIPGNPEANDMTYDIPEVPRSRFVIFQRQLLAEFFDIVEIEIFSFEFI